MKKYGLFQYLYPCMLFFLFIETSSAQETNPIINASLSGTVLDFYTKEPIEGVTVQLEAVTHSVKTDRFGKFQFVTGQKLPFTITLSNIGYEKKTLVVQTSPTVIELKPKVEALDEVVITGYTVQQKKAISGSIATVNFKEDNLAQADQDFVKLLQGKVAGAQITATSGVPGGGVSFVVRGNNSINGNVAPLYVVDGVFLSTTLPVTGGGGNLLSNPLADINPADIESVTILKDANATAIYGSQGANGVVLIKTKRGQRNTASRINFSTKQGFSQAVNKFKAVTGPETGQLLYESWFNTATENQESLASYLTREKPTNWDLVFPFKNGDGSTDFSRDNISNLPTYDRISDLFKNAYQVDYQVALYGGGSNSNHYIGLRYSGQESIVRPNDFNRFSLRVNYDNNVTERLKVGTSYNLARVGRSNVRNNDNDPGGIINSAIFPRSFLPVFDAQGNYLNHATFNNHLRLIEHLDNNYTTWRNTVNLFAEYSILSHLKFKTSGSFDYTSNGTRSFSDFALSNTGAASAGNNLIQVYTAEQLLTYVKSFGNKHDVNFLLGNTINVQQSQNVGASGTNYIFDVLREVSSGGTTSGTSSRNENRLVSFFGNAGYTFDKRYALEFSLRADGSSRFGKNVRWGYFPAGGFIWNVGQERFLRDNTIINGLKLRTTFGLSGNQNGIGDYDALAVWSTNAQSYLDQPSLSPGRLANPDLTWETTRQTNIGTDAVLLNNRLNITFDWYYKYTTNGLQSVVVPSRSGYTSAIRNYTEISNRGLELTVESTNIRKPHFNWQTSFNISRNRNRIEKIPQEQTLGATNRGTSILRQGYPINSFFLYKQLYVDPQTGNAVYEDVDGNGVVNYADRQILGNTEPNFIGGLTNTFNYKGVELSAFLYFTQGNHLLNMHNFFLVHGGIQNGIGFDPRQLQRWQKTGDVTDIPKMTRYALNPEQNNAPANNYTGQVANLSSRYLEDGSFLRLRNVSIGYTLPQALAAKLKLYRLKATVSATNLWTWTNYGGLDPEVSAQSTNQNTAGYDWATVPQPRTFEFILNITL
ncbi:SusC/RagA family TonB-linked outer membrane protein [Sphingobacterium psychroaquaticum]|nr:SusC/RagA family TonB-linked outer membrane protein [Sphingobacterium psychroaquaticum]